MSASLKHELRTPLNHIIGYCEMLMEEAQDHARDAWLPDLERIHAAGKRLLGVVNDLFDPSKADALRNNPRQLDHELRTPLNQIIGYSEMLQEEAREQALDRLLADLDRIHTAAHRLLELVIEHFVPAGGAAGRPEAIVASDATTFLLRTSAARARERAAVVRAMTPGPTGALLVVDDDEANR
ncbi:MAG TPA: histidine kinase dimerization/phospho-acceptor domain-containing protein, partial [Verrucomicrobiae bacterium]|nr:histidine kinase dimerization/phospho-acceptor domain-containing protein [Verrucomicrobiae bacterium]